MVKVEVLVLEGGENERKVGWGFTWEQKRVDSYLSFITQKNFFSVPQINSDVKNHVNTIIVLLIFPLFYLAAVSNVKGMQTLIFPPDCR